ncbi:phosphoribosylanthranilate isomerase [Desulfobacterales bacterium HSG16]|nr:phosphoribosylanthranilate isomerase [Desulfobacterales bacterium HSG16]
MKKIPEIKICGLTDPDHAVACALAGADAVGCVFFEKSPRNLDNRKAREICHALPDDVASIGVFVNEDFSHIMKKVEFCGLDGVQLHGHESPELAHDFLREGLIVIKALFTNKKPDFSDADLYSDAGLYSNAGSSYEPSAFLVECGKGVLPGGNAQTWNYEEAGQFAGRYPFIIAGGLGPENIVEAIKQSNPDGVDVSSGVEASPGVKDILRVKEFIRLVNLAGVDRKDGEKTKRIFNRE